MSIGTPKVGTPTYWSSGSGTAAWPAGVAAGDFVALNIAGNSSGTDKRQPDDFASGWNVWKKTFSTHSWWRIVDAAYLAANPSGIPCKGRIVFVTAISNVGGVGAVTESPGATMSVAGACLLMFGRGKSALTPATGKLYSDVTNPSYDNRRNNVWFRAGTAVGYLAVDGTFNGTDSDGFELLPKAGPTVPTLLSPATGDAIDYTAALTFLVQHNSSQSAPMEQMKLRVRMSGGSWAYVLADGTTTATETAVSTSTPSLTLNASTLSAGTAEWQAATSDNGTWSPWADVQSFISTTRPTVNSVTLTTGAGNLTPTVAWTETVEVAQRAYEVRICAAADSNWSSPVWQSFVQPGAALSVEAQASAWTNGGSYKAWVQVTQQNGLKSLPVASSAQTISWTAPTAPTVSAANQASGPVLVTVGSIGGGYVRVDVESSTDAGSTWSAVATRTPSGGTEVFADPAALYATATRWRARVWNMVDGVALPSAWTAMGADVSSTDTRPYLISDTDHTDYVRVEIASPTVFTPVEGYAVSYGLGASGATVDRSERQGFTGKTSLQTLQQADETALDAWLQAHSTFLFRWPPEHDGGVLVAKPCTRMMQAAAAPITPNASWGSHTPRTFELDWVGR